MFSVAAGWPSVSPAAVISWQFPTVGELLLIVAIAGLEKLNARQASTLLHSLAQASAVWTWLSTAARPSPRTVWSSMFMAGSPNNFRAPPGQTGRHSSSLLYVLQPRALLPVASFPRMPVAVYSRQFLSVGVARYDIPWQAAAAARHAHAHCALLLVLWAASCPVPRRYFPQVFAVG